MPLSANKVIFASANARNTISPSLMRGRRATKKHDGTLEIGAIIKAKLRENNRSVVWLAEQLECSRTNIYKMFNKHAINTNELLKISKALNFDFFRLYSEYLNKQTRRDS